MRFGIDFSLTLLNFDSHVGKNYLPIDFPMILFNFESQVGKKNNPKSMPKDIINNRKINNDFNTQNEGIAGRPGTSAVEA